MQFTWGAGGSALQNWAEHIILLTRMPDLRLSDQEAKDITAYLLSFRNQDFEEL